MENMITINDAPTQEAQKAAMDALRHAEIQYNVDDSVSPMDALKREVEKSSQKSENFMDILKSKAMTDHTRTTIQKAIEIEQNSTGIESEMELE